MIHLIRVKVFKVFLDSKGSLDFPVAVDEFLMYHMDSWKPFDGYFMINESNQRAFKGYVLIIQSYRLCTIRLPMHPNEALLTLQNYDFLTICCIFPTGSSTGNKISQINECTGHSLIWDEPDVELFPYNCNCFWLSITLSIKWWIKLNMSCLWYGLTKYKIGSGIIPTGSEIISTGRDKTYYLKP